MRYPLVWATLALAAFVAGLAGCSEEESPSAPEEESMELPATMTVVTCDYALVSSDTMQVTLPPMPACDTATGAVTQTGDTTTRAYYTMSEEHLKVSMSQLSPLMRVMTSGPSFSDDIGEALQTLEELEAQRGIAILAVLTRVDDGSGLEGLWAFSNLGPDAISLFLAGLPDTSSLAKAVNDMVADEQGRPVVLFEFEGQTLTGLLNRAAYGEGAIANLVDATVFDISVTAHDDSTWTLAGAVSSETVALSVDGQGGIAYHHSDASTYPDYAFVLWPLTCPDPLAPEWFAGFRDRNRR